MFSTGVDHCHPVGGSKGELGALAGESFLARFQIKRSDKDERHAG